MRFGLAATALLAGCATTVPPGADGASATLAGPDGRIVGRATVTQERDGARVVVELEGLAAGTYGAHIHRTGLCEDAAFNSAGSHWNPTGQQHGFRNPSGRHRGDLPNLVVDAASRGRLRFTIRAVRVRGEVAIIDADGAAVIIHARADDYRADPSGNSGARIACGVLR